MEPMGIQERTEPARFSKYLSPEAQNALNHLQSLASALDP